MSQASSQAWAFYREVAKKRVLWTIRDAGGYPVPVTSSGKRAQPFWSSRSRAERVISSVPAYAGFEAVEITWTDFCDNWVPDFVRDGQLVGINWSGPRASGYDLEPGRALQCIQALIDDPTLSAARSRDDWQRSH
jgi:hypothetical protein